MQRYRHRSTEAMTLTLKTRRSCTGLKQVGQACSQGTSTCASREDSRIIALLVSIEILLLRRCEGGVARACSCMYSTHNFRANAHNTASLMSQRYVAQFYHWRLYAARSVHELQISAQHASGHGNAAASSWLRWHCRSHANGGELHQRPARR